MDNDNMDRGAFVRKDENKKIDSFTTRLNNDERDWLNAQKKILNIKGDSTAMKVLAVAGSNVLHNTFGDRYLKYLFKKDREKLSDYETF